MVQQEHRFLQMLVPATAVILLLMLTKQPMEAMEGQRILEEGPPMFLVDFIPTDARELRSVRTKICMFLSIEVSKLQVHCSLAFTLCLSFHVVP